MSSGRETDALRGASGGGVGHGSVDPLRARLAGAVRDIGAQLRGLTEGLKGYGERLAGYFRDGWCADAGDREAAERHERAGRSLGESLGRADAANDSLGRCREQVAQRATELERQVERENDRGMSWGL